MCDILDYNAWFLYNIIEKPLCHKYMTLASQVYEIAEDIVWKFNAIDKTFLNAE